MDLREYYNLPEGTNATLSFIPSFFDTVDTPYPCPSSMKNAFAYYKGKSIPELDTSKVTNMSYMFEECTKLTTIDVIENLDTSKVTDMSYMFDSCNTITSLDLSNFDTSNVTNMGYMFYYCANLQEVKGFENCDTSKVTSMNNMFNYCANLISLSVINCGGISTKNYYPLTSYSSYNYLTDLGGFLNMKMSWDSSNGLYKCPNLTYESCINVLNGLYDFTGNGETPSSNQGKLKVHQNFLNLVGDEISIGTNKGWTITA